VEFDVGSKVEERCAVRMDGVLTLKVTTDGVGELEIKMEFVQRFSL